MIKRVKSILTPKNLPRVLVLVFILAVLFYFYSNYLKEGFEVESKDFESKIKTSDKTLVLFYAEWCGHCEKFRPIWDEAEKEAESRGFKMLKVNVGDNKEHDKRVTEKYGVEGFPTILVFKNGSHKEYEGERTKESLLKTFS